ncbi:hypothetical protein KC19_VG073400 [Ceratodon purpureus]|uniref:Secreted protein n=1 Tax=Ceratodon purpureus TaxID=3225 RepID=A0A8T0HMX9_CERPU|nr:hypothetical protein KC19_VG073400 [Ceratodon purpureus]
MWKRICLTFCCHLRLLRGLQVQNIQRSVSMTLMFFLLAQLLLPSCMFSRSFFLRRSGDPLRSGRGNYVVQG